MAPLAHQRKHVILGNNREHCVSAEGVMIFPTSLPCPSKQSLRGFKWVNNSTTQISKNMRNINNTAIMINPWWIAHEYSRNQPSILNRGFSLKRSAGLFSWVYEQTKDYEHFDCAAPNAG
eukprot:CAMPEP_0172440892 /NCGR_PEP_ID=MMETSP1065-20121228/1510_1 /TAXON_ID=265537 /ORGANISM="Amphiprora paludosa, Strain CCMP125" /LENGTH=119 /DNA_ID=CAMNT_0013189987 /DNA_START=82 /DNA_END=441 /DNA_ORIENTATION=+